MHTAETYETFVFGSFHGPIYTTGNVVVWTICRSYKHDNITKYWSGKTWSPNESDAVMFEKKHEAERALTEIVEQEFNCEKNF